MSSPIPLKPPITGHRLVLTNVNCANCAASLVDAQIKESSWRTQSHSKAYDIQCCKCRESYILCPDCLYMTLSHYANCHHCNSSFHSRYVASSPLISPIYLICPYCDRLIESFDKPSSMIPIRCDNCFGSFFEGKRVSKKELGIKIKRAEEDKNRHHEQLRMRVREMYKEPVKIIPVYKSEGSEINAAKKGSWWKRFIPG